MSGTHESSPGVDGDAVRPAHEPESQADEISFEVSDLRRSDPAFPDGKEPVRWYRQRVQVPRPLAAAVLVFMLGLILLIATPIGAALLAFSPHSTPTPANFVSSTTAPATATLSPYPTPTLIAPAIGSFPANCPPGAPLVDFAPHETYSGVGGSDVWLIGLDGAGAHAPASGQHAAAQLGTLRPSDYTPFGWPVQVKVYIKRGPTQTITFTGRDLRTGYPLWLSPDSDHPQNVSAAAPLVTIDLGQRLSGGHTTDGQWDILFGILYLPGAGCYTLQANWPGNGWVVNFAAGR